MLLPSNFVCHVLDANQDISYLDSLLDEKDLLKVVDSSFYSNVPQEHLTIFGHKHGIYCFPTTELAEWLKSEINNLSAIEIGSGNGALARHLGIPATDSRYMELPEIKAYYASVRQPVTKYPDDIIKLDAISAIKKYKPNVVIGCWITHKYREDEHERGGNMYGVDEDWLIKNVNKYIVIGNEKIHGIKRILKLPHKEFKFPWLYSRSLEPSKNIIYVWEHL